MSHGNGRSRSHSTTPPVRARIEADYRWRVAGNAEPGNGGVVTLSTGF
ncbi:MAG: hypothetical protein V7664_00270 [Qipengyuania sp.]